MIKKVFSDIDSVKTSLGLSNEESWNSLIQEYSIIARQIIVSEFGWDPQEHEQIDYIDGFGHGPVILTHENITDLISFAIYNGTEYIALENIPRWFKNGSVDYNLRKGFKLAKIVYTAGWLINFEVSDILNNEDDDGVETHNLPADIQDLSNRIIKKLHLTKTDLHKKSTSFQGSTDSYSEILGPLEMSIIKKYKRVWT